MVSVEGAVDAMVTCGGRKRGGSQARMVGRRSTGSRAINACSSRERSSAPPSPARFHLGRMQPAAHLSMQAVAHASTGHVDDTVE